MQIEQDHFGWFFMLRWRPSGITNSSLYDLPLFDVLIKMDRLGSHLFESMVVGKMLGDFPKRNDDNFIVYDLMDLVEQIPRLLPVGNTT